MVLARRQSSRPRGVARDTRSPETRLSGNCFREGRPPCRIFLLVAGVRKRSVGRHGGRPSYGMGNNSHSGHEDFISEFPIAFTNCDVKF
jgi:hypothetical protein